MKKYLSKTLSIIFTVCILISAIPMASAAETGDIQLYAGDKVTYQVPMPESDEDEICAFHVETTYNASKLEFESLEWNEKLLAFLLTYADTERNDVHYVNYCGSTYCDYEFAAGDTFATVTYTVKEDMMLSEAGLDNVIILIGYSDDVTNETYELLRDAKPEGIVEVIRLSENHYDVNGDGRVSVQDVTAIQKHCASLEVLPSDKISVADINMDGKVNILDATELQKYLVKN